MRYNEIMIRLAILLIILLVVALGLYRITKQVPFWSWCSGPIYPVSAGCVLFLSDKTYTKADGTRVREQEILGALIQAYS